MNKLSLYYCLLFLSFNPLEFYAGRYIGFRELQRISREKIRIVLMEVHELTHVISGFIPAKIHTFKTAILSNSLKFHGNFSEFYERP